MDEARRCRAKSKQSQQRCKRAAIRGGAVCTMHGGKIPAVQQSARDRLLAMVEPALVALRKLVDTADSDSVRLSAIRDILDRTGYKPTEKVQTEGRQVIEIEYVDVPMPTPYKAQNGHVARS